jgi:hypothetical protein
MNRRISGGGRVRNLRVPDGQVLDGVLAGGSPSLLPPPKLKSRQLDARSIRAALRRPPKLAFDAQIDVDFDESGSVTGGNDAVGHRHELTLIALEHLASASGVSRGRWYVRIFTFDGGSSIDLPLTRLDRKGLVLVRQALLSQSAGGSSRMGPSWRRAEATTGAVRGPRLAIVETDFELFDPLPETLIEVVNSSATEVLAIALANEPPEVFTGTRVRTARVLPDDDPADLASHIIEAACACVSQPLSRR